MGTMTEPQSTSLKSLTKDDIQKAFEKTRQKFEIPGVKMVLITEDYYEQALQFCREYFFPFEPVSNALGVEWSDEIEMFILELVLKQHLSLMFIDEKTGEAIAFRTTMIISRDDDKIELGPDTPSNLKEYHNYFQFCEEQVDFFGNLGIEEAVRFVTLAVAEKYKRRGYATKIFNAAIDMVRNFGFEKIHIKGEGSSNYSKKIYEKEGFKTMYENIYATWESNGQRPLLNTGEHKSVKVYVYTVTQDV